MKTYWLSWYHQPDIGFEMHWPWWVSGQRCADNFQTICAAVKAVNESAAKGIIEAAIGDAVDGPVHIEWRFCTERDPEWEPFSDRFPRADWMKWPEKYGGLSIDYTDGRWIATTMGQFIQILVDSGNDPCVIFRVDEDEPHSDESFIRKMTVYSVPNGAVVQTCRDLGIVGSDTHGVYKVLRDLITAGLVT